MTTLRWAVRQLLHTPKLTIAAVLCIGLGAALLATMEIVKAVARRR